MQLTSLRPLCGQVLQRSRTATRPALYTDPQQQRTAVASSLCPLLANAVVIPGRRASRSTAVASCRRLSTVSTPLFARWTSFASNLSCSSRRTYLTAKPLRRRRTLVNQSTMATALRNASTATDSNSTVYEAVVAGSGPGGITALGNLLENRIHPILWVDPAFDGGRVNQYYREVPSNTKVKLFIDYALACTPFRRIMNATPSRDRWDEPSGSDGVAVHDASLASTDKLQTLRRLEQESGCQLSHAADVCLALTEGLRRDPGVTFHQGSVSSATLDEKSSTWTVQVASPSHQTPQTIQSKRLFLCTGSHPSSPPLPITPSTNLQSLDLDVVLSPTRLAAALSNPHTSQTVAVIGASHSAILVLMNLSHLALTTHPNLRIKWFTRHPLRYAEYEADFIARDNTGLKGQAAVWARENLEPEALPNSPIAKFLQKIAYEKGDEAEAYKQHFAECDFYVQAIGYERNPVPQLTRSDSGAVVEPVFDHEKGVFYDAAKIAAGDADRAVIPGLFGVGIAFPERVRDRKYGHIEFNVGFIKFMKAAKKWAPTWVVG